LQELFWGENSDTKFLSSYEIPLIVCHDEVAFTGDCQFEYQELVWKIWTSQKAVLSDKLLGSCR